jgi:tRNA threonylcarbamoyladenosine biosynthesis protein TsaB
VLVLAVDTATPRASLALVRSGELLGEIRLSGEASHSSRVLPAVEFLLGSLDLGPQAVEGYAVSSGPGSFTGLRIGISTVQGMALASGRPCLAVSTLDLLAARIRGAAESLVAVMNAFREEVFACLYDAEARPLGPPTVESPERLLSRVPSDAAFFGDGVTVYRDQIESACKDAVFPERSLFLAGTLARLAEARLEAGEGVPPDRLRPLYVREPSIRKGRE